MQEGATVSTYLCKELHSYLSDGQILFIIYFPTSAKTNIDSKSSVVDILVAPKYF
jgi:hypothetical protein